MKKGFFMYRQRPGHIANLFIYKEWDFIRATRKYLHELITCYYKDQIYGEKVISASNELIENAYKYSPEDSDINVILYEMNNNLFLEVRNYCLEEPEDALEIIKNEIEKVYSYDDPNIAFKEKVIESMERKDSKSMLGFAKIRLETEAICNVELQFNGLLIVQAKFVNNDKK